MRRLVRQGTLIRMVKSPDHLQAPLRQAGASVYQWADEAAVECVDPCGRWRRAAMVVSWVAAVVAAVAQVSVAAKVTWLCCGVTSLVCAVAVTVSVRDRKVSPWLWWCGVVGVGLTTPTGVVVLAVGGLVWCVVRAPGKHFIGTAAGFWWAWVVAAGLGTGGTVAAGGGLVAGCLAAGQVAGWQPAPRPWARIRETDFSFRTPPPPSTIPWLVQWVKRVALDNLPDDVADTVSARQAGGYGERRTGIALLSTRRWRGTRILHDVVIPAHRGRAESAVANIDHVVVTRSGLFVIDSKQFGTRANPGVVTRDVTGGLVHRVTHSDGTVEEKSLAQAAQTLVWAADAVTERLGVPPGQVAAVLLVHRARVERNLWAEYATQAGGQRRVVLAATPWDVVAMIDHALPAAGWSPARVVWRLSRLRAAAGGRVQITRPRGSTRGLVRARLQWQQQVAAPQRTSSPVVNAPVSPVPVANHRNWVPKARRSGRAAAPPAPRPGVQQPLLVDHGHELAAVDGGATIAADWAAMEDHGESLADPATLMDGDRLQLVVRGRVLTLISTRETVGSPIRVVEQDWVAMTPVLTAGTGLWVWAVDRKDWPRVKAGERVPLRAITFHDVTFLVKDDLLT